MKMRFFASVSKKKSKSSFGNRLADKLFFLQSRLLDNLSRVESLISVRKLIRDSNQKTGPVKSDILRAAVVFMHAALEDYLRGLSQVYLPVSTEHVLNKIPLMGASDRRSEKFQLGALLTHKHRKVGKLIELSVAEYLRSTTYNNTTQIENLLTDLGKSRWPNIESTYPEIAELMQRRHQIVHRADNALKRQKSAQKAAPITLSQVNAWLSSVRQFQKIIEVGIINDEYTKEMGDGYIAYLLTLGERRLLQELDDQISESSDDLLDAEPACIAIAETNASGFYVDDCQIKDYAIDEKKKECRAQIAWHATGVSDPEKPYSGDEITGTAFAVLNDASDLRFEEVSAERVDGFES